MDEQIDIKVMMVKISGVDAPIQHGIDCEDVDQLVHAHDLQQDLSI